MLVEMPAVPTDEAYPYNVLVNIERIMFVTPMQEGDEDFVRLFMNVANSRGEPSALDIDMTYDEFKLLIENETKKED